MKPIIAILIVACGLCGWRLFESRTDELTETTPDGTRVYHTDSEGKLHGIDREFWPNGKLKRDIRWWHGQFGEKATHYDQDGNLVQENKQ